MLQCEDRTAKQVDLGMLPNNNSPNNPGVGSPGSGYHAGYYNNGGGFSPGAPSPQQQQFGAGRDNVYQQQQQQAYFYANNNGNSNNMQNSGSTMQQQAPSPNNRQFTVAGFPQHSLVPSSGQTSQHQFTVPYPTSSMSQQQQRPPSSQGPIAASNMNFVRSAQLQQQQQQQSPMPVLQGHLQQQQQQQQPSPGQQNMMQMQQIRLQQQQGAGGGQAFQLQQQQGGASALQRLLGPGQQQTVHQGFVGNRSQPTLVQQQHQFSPMTSSHHQMQNNMSNHLATSIQQSAMLQGSSHGMSTPVFHQNQHPGVSTENDEFSNTPLLTKQRLEDLAREIDPYEQLDDEVKDALLQYADDFIESVATSACQLAKHRNSSVLEAKDVLLTLERNWNMWIPGYGVDEVRPAKKACTTEAHKQRMALIKKTLRKI